ncbi:14503_t:CDS:2 [Dentiscutata heterogama]|uniref:14503_t:CDS:1 n=1 Tax=Dentiscutata heterogama TaxID=1316150 RepID=A0ACA9L0Y5_9GLOM|nr:14503_t:CDS:2 [Dentiscutata heterogama]
MEEKSIRVDEISDCRQRAIICKESNLNSSQIFKSISNMVVNNPCLTKHEKKYIINDLIIIRDAQNVIADIGERRHCEYCNNPAIAITYCENCIRNYLERDFSKWTTGNSKFDKLIQERQINSVSPSDIFEWIPFEKFTNLVFKEEGTFSLIYAATWEDGPFTEWDTENQELKRSGGEIYILKSLKNSRTADEQWFKDVTSSCPKTEATIKSIALKPHATAINYGTITIIITQSITTNAAEKLHTSEPTYTTINALGLIVVIVPSYSTMGVREGQEQLFTKASDSEQKNSNHPVLK